MLFDPQSIQIAEGPAGLPVDKRMVPVSGWRGTVRLMKRFARLYARDVQPYLRGATPRASILNLYNQVRALPYVADPPGLETIARPAHTMRKDWSGPRDCDDKSIIIAAGAQLLGIPWRFVVCGQADHPHHVYPEIYFVGRWTSADATFPERSAWGKKLYKEKFRKVC